jgi:hypothetical protein
LSIFGTERRPYAGTDNIFLTNMQKGENCKNDLPPDNTKNAGGLKMAMVVILKRPDMLNAFYLFYQKTKFELITDTIN